MNTERITIKSAGEGQALKVWPKPACTGAGADGDHCCYVGGKQCKYLRFDHPERKYACGLMMKYGSEWGVMVASPEYQEIGEHWETTNKPFNYCETFNPMFCS